MDVYQCEEWQCRFVFPDNRCCVQPKGHGGDHRPWSTLPSDLRRRARFLREALPHAMDFGDDRIINESSVTAISDLLEQAASALEQHQQQTDARITALEAQIAMLTTELDAARRLVRTDFAHWLTRELESAHASVDVYHIKQLRKRAERAEAQIAALQQLRETWLQRRTYLIDHVKHEPLAAEQAHVYNRCADELEQAILAGSSSSGSQKS